MVSGQAGAPRLRDVIAFAFLAGNRLRIAIYRSFDRYRCRRSCRTVCSAISSQTYGRSNRRIAARLSLRRWRPRHREVLTGIPSCPEPLHSSRGSFARVSWRRQCGSRSRSRPQPPGTPHSPEPVLPMTSLRLPSGPETSVLHYAEVRAARARAPRAIQGSQQWKYHGLARSDYPPEREPFYAILRTGPRFTAARLVRTAPEAERAAPSNERRTSTASGAKVSPAGGVNSKP